MKFKGGVIEKAKWLAEGSPKMKLISIILDAISLLYYDEEIVITSAIREPREGRKSFHPKGQALDFRTNDVPKKLIYLWMEIVGKMNTAEDVLNVEGHFDCIWESQDMPNEHLHIEWDTNDPI
jgi:hypothetical protein